ncbi:MAG: hypothetical protein HFH68_13785 [Lachnospiraceae bacterium]|nr:hypothetical protein [Lachnospiraceae bacterium]
MNNFVYKKSWYKLFLGKWYIVIILEAGYKELCENESESGYIKICGNLYFSSLCLPYPDSTSLNEEELNCFCKGLELVSAQIMDAMQNKPCLIQLRSIIFSDCNIQDDAFTASAVQWASEVFKFSMPKINVWFDDTVEPCGVYKFDFADGWLPYNRNTFPERK